MEKENLEDFNEFSYGLEIEKNFNMTGWEDDDVKALLRLDDEQFEYLINRTEKQASAFRWRKAVNGNIRFEGDCYLTAIGVYLFLELNKDLKKYEYFNNYIPFFREEALDDLIRYNGFKLFQGSKSKRKNPSYDFEKQGEYDSKVISKELKESNLEIEDKTHLFYNKKVLITGTFENYPDRKEMAALIQKVGGLNKGIGKGLDYVIVGYDAGPSKLKKIEEWNLKTLTEDEFIKLFN